MLLREDESLAVNLTKRYLVGELMDAPDLAEQEHHQALNGLRRVNQLSRTANIISSAIIDHSKKRAPGILRVLDLACGGGDVTVQVAKRLKHAGLSAEVHGWDRSPTAIDYARQAQCKGLPRVHFEVADALASKRDGSFEIVYSTLFLHHLTEAEAERLLKVMCRTASQLMLIDDLRRSTVGYALALVGCRLLSRSPIVHVDGPLSVRAAFTENEILQLSDRCELPRPSVKRHWPHRFLLAWTIRP